MANSLARPTSDPDELTEKAKDLRLLIVDQLASGARPPDIARRLAPDDPVRRKAIRQKLWRWLSRDQYLINSIHERARAVLNAGLIEVSDSLVARAAELGRPEIAKLVFEASTFHNPRVQHDHSGDIKISLSIPRPELPHGHDDMGEKAGPQPTAEVVDAEVVGED